jgi:hypothetical protein
MHYYENNSMRNFKVYVTDILIRPSLPSECSPFIRRCKCEIYFPFSDTWVVSKYLSKQAGGRSCWLYHLGIHEPSNLPGQMSATAY